MTGVPVSVTIVPDNTAMESVRVPYERMDLSRSMAGKKSSSKRVPKSETGFTAEERAAMKDRAQEIRARRRTGTGDGERDLLAKIAEMQGSDRVMAERLHAIIKANAPGLSPRTWYGMPAYSKDDQVVCFFRNAGKFKTRYATLGFSDEAHLDDGQMWPTDFALTALTATEEARIIALLKRALG
jgi:uncharacterized protein YdhG (YjbR/CyaY superfamily)